MVNQLSFIPEIPVEKLKVWVLSPNLVTEDPNIEYYYDFTQSIAEYTVVFKSLNIPWHWQPVTLNDYSSIIDTIADEMQVGAKFPVVLNLCDGDEINGTPGISVIKKLLEKQIVFTGADEHFYSITTSKIPMKQCFDANIVATPKWEPIFSIDESLDGIFERLGTPIIVKPAISGGSMGIGIKNVVSTMDELEKQLKIMFEGYRGWNLSDGGIIAEEFIVGKEFTSFIVGSAKFPNQIQQFLPIERVFHPSLPENERFLSFDRLWEIYEEETPMPEEQNFYEYQLPKLALHDSIQQLSLDAFNALGGTGYTRIDIRMDATTNKLYVLEANAQCGLSEDENYTSIGAILRVSEKSFTEIIVAIINDAFRRYFSNSSISESTQKIKYENSRTSTGLFNIFG
jgi:D-alanine-D-alanine ligase